MSIWSILAPIPKMHLEGALKVLEAKEFVLFGTENCRIFDQTPIGSPVFIYLSHAGAASGVSYEGSYQGLVKDKTEMMKLEKAGYRPPIACDESWSYYWKVNSITKLSIPRPLSDFQLASGKYVAGPPHKPLHVRN